MNKQKEKKLEELERRQREIADEIQKLREKPERPEPRAGQVWYDPHCDLELILGSKGSISPDGREWRLPSPNITECLKYLGTFDEVFVRKQDVIDALSIEDLHGRSVINDSGCGVGYAGINRTRKALAKLGITAKE